MSQILPQIDEFLGYVNLMQSREDAGFSVKERWELIVHFRGVFTDWVGEHCPVQELLMV